MNRLKTRRARLRLTIILSVVLTVLGLNGIALIQLLSGGGASGFLFANGIIVFGVGLPLAILGTHRWIEKGD